MNEALFCVNMFRSKNFQSGTLSHILWPHNVPFVTRYEIIEPIFILEITLITSKEKLKTWKIEIEAKPTLEETYKLNPTIEAIYLIGIYYVSAMC